MAAVGRDRTQLRCAAPRALGVRRQRGHVDRRGGGPGAREGDHLRRHARHLGGEGDACSACPTVRASRHASSARSRTRGQHRHDRAERLGGRRTRTSRSRCRRPISPRRRADPRDRRRRRSTRRASPTTRTSRRSRSIGAGMKSHPGVAADMFEALARGRHQHRDHLDVVDPRLVRRAGGRRRAARCRRCIERFRGLRRGARRWLSRESRWSARPARSVR